MSLWSPGTLTITGRHLTSVLEECWNEHREHSQHPMYHSPLDMVIKEIVPYNQPGPDNWMDRISHARWNNEEFWYEGERYVVTGYGAGWTITNVDTGATRRDLSEEHLAQVITVSCGKHPNPYVLMVEIEYNTGGNCAGYGIRANGESNLFYN